MINSIFLYYAFQKVHSFSQDVFASETSGDWTLQSVRYEAPHGWYAEHVDTRFTWNRLNHTYSERVVAAIVQLSDRHSRGDYTGGELQLVLQSM